MRISTGIEGLDEKVGGGFVPGSTILVTGKTGTGKTAFCSSFMYKSVSDGVPTVYLTTEESIDDLKGDINSMFGWNLEPLESKGMLKFISVRPTFPTKTTVEMGQLAKLYIYEFYRKIEEAIKEIKAKRLIIDSISIIEMFIKDEYMSRAALLTLAEKLKQLGLTTIITGTVPETSEALSGGGIIEYLVDCIIKLDFVPVAERFRRTLTVRKMRRTDHSILIHPFEITKSGIRIMEIPES